ncbi:MAG: hypothetical protein NZ520_00220 [bacterium]|nr:hypothetical protein [bacterium]MCS7308806.1 hypothetical protein [Armatimonadota bacterium]
MRREEQQRLMHFLRVHLEARVQCQPPPSPPSPREVPTVWQQPGGMFVTLEVAHRVRGCSGSLFPCLPHRWQEAQQALEHALRAPDGREGVVLPYEGRVRSERLRWAYQKAGAPIGSPAQLYRLRAVRSGD